MMQRPSGLALLALAALSGAFAAESSSGRPATRPASGNAAQDPATAAAKDDVAEKEQFLAQVADDGGELTSLQQAFDKPFDEEEEVKRPDGDTSLALVENNRGSESRELYFGGWGSYDWGWGSYDWYSPHSHYPHYHYPVVHYHWPHYHYPHCETPPAQARPPPPASRAHPFWRPPVLSAIPWCCAVLCCAVLCCAVLCCA